MKKRLGALLLAVMMVMGIALLAGCSQKDAPPGVEKNTLVGTWKLADAGDDEMNAELEGASAFLSFSEDGLWKFWYEVEIDGEIIEDGWGVYRISEDNLILLRPEEVDSYNDDEFENAAIYKISGTTLTITDTYDDGTTTMRLTRVQ